MKRIIKPKRWIEIVVYVDPSLPQDIAATEQKHPSSQFKFTDSELQLYLNFVDAMISPIEAHGFKIVKEYQSNKSYAYYVHFYPVNKIGELLDEVYLIFRVAEHLMKHREVTIAKRRFIKNFTINDLNYDDVKLFQDRVDYICDRLSEGDYSELIAAPTKFE